MARTPAAGGIETTVWWAGRNRWCVDTAPSHCTRVSPAQNNSHRVTSGGIQYQCIAMYILFKRVPFISALSYSVLFEYTSCPIAAFTHRIAERDRCVHAPRGHRCPRCVSLYRSWPACTVRILNGANKSEKTSRNRRFFQGENLEGGRAPGALREPPHGSSCRPGSWRRALPPC